MKLLGATIPLSVIWIFKEVGEMASVYHTFSTLRLYDYTVLGSSGGNFQPYNIGF
jgi:hypothetical protein